MREIFVLRRLDSLPWPAGLGKFEYPGLERRMRALMGSRWGDAEAHRDGLAANLEYRLIADEELSQAHWADGLLETVAEATRAARQAPLLNRPLTGIAEWRQWAELYREQSGYPVFTTLAGLAHVCGDKLNNGRHRLTYLRLHADPSTEVPVRITR
jgi:hypothetical protein